MTINTDQGSCSQSLHAFTCNLNTLLNIGLVTITVQGVVTTATTSLSNSAQVTESEIDSNPTNNAANVSTTIYQVPRTGNAFLTIRKTVDSTGNPTPRQARDFQLRVKEGASVDAFFPGSDIGTTIGLGVDMPTVFTVDEANPDSSYLTTFQCDGVRSNLDLNQVKLDIGDSRSCTVTNTYLGTRNAGGQANAVLKVIKPVDNTGAPTAKQPADFTMDVKVGSAIVDASPGSANGVNVGLHVTSLVLSFTAKVVEAPADPNYIATFSGDCDSDRRCQSERQ